MKRPIITILLGASLVSAAAQPGFQFGAKFIPTSAWFLNEDDAGTASARSAYGLGINYHFNDGAGVGLDFIWSTEEQVIQRDGSEWIGELSFFKLPLLLHFNSGSDDVVPFVGYVGIEYVQLRKARVSVNGVDMDGIDLVDENGDPAGIFRADEAYRSTNLGAVLGLGPGWNINERLQLTAIVRTDYLFHDPEEKDASLYWNDRPKTSLFTLGLDIGLKVILGAGGG